MIVSVPSAEEVQERSPDERIEIVQSRLRSRRSLGQQEFSTLADHLLAAAQSMGCEQAFETRTGYEVSFLLTATSGVKFTALSALMVETEENRRQALSDLVSFLKYWLER